MRHRRFADEPRLGKGFARPTVNVDMIDNQRPTGVHPDSRTLVGNQEIRCVIQIGKPGGKHGLPLQVAIVLSIGVTLRSLHDNTAFNLLNSGNHSRTLKMENDLDT